MACFGKLYIRANSYPASQLLGMNVSDARRSATHGRWSGDIVKHIGRHMLDAIAGVHKLGFIHRDIKPANFALTPRHVPVTEGQQASAFGECKLDQACIQLLITPRPRRWQLDLCTTRLMDYAVCDAGAWHVLDFGLARKFIDDDGAVLPQRDKKEFRGSTSYASVAAHKLEDLGASPCSSLLPANLIAALPLPRTLIQSVSEGSRTLLRAARRLVVVALRPCGDVGRDPAMAQIDCGPRRHAAREGGMRDKPRATVQPRCYARHAAFAL